MSTRHLPWTLAALAVVAIVLGPWLLGQRAEQGYLDAVAAMEGQPPGLRIVSAVYRRGWLASEASIELSPAAGDLAEDLRMRIDSRISHGPRDLTDLTWPPTMARVRGTLELAHPAALLSGIQADTRIGWHGETLTRIALPAIDQPADGESPGLRTAAGQGVLRLGPAAGAIEAGLDLPSVELLGGDGSALLSVGNLRVAGGTTPWLPGLSIGSADISIAELRATSPDGLVEALDLRLSLQGKPQGGLLDVRLSYGAGVLRIGGADYAPAKVELSMARLDGATLAALQADLDGLAGKALPEAMAGIATAALLLKHLPALAAADPAFALDDLDILTPSGPVKGRLALGLEGLTAADLRGRGIWLRRLVGEGELSLPRAVALGLITELQRQAAAGGAFGAPGPETEQGLAEAAATQVDTLIQEGWIGTDGERLRTALRLSDGLLTINGKTLPLGGALPMESIGPL